MSRPDRAEAAASLLGFFLVANVYLQPTSGSSPRAFDLLAAGCALWMARALFGRGVPGSPLAALFLMALPVTAWAGVAAVTGKSATLLLSLRWLLGVPWGLALAAAASRQQTRRPLAWGLWWGLAANVAVLGLQFAGLLDLTRALGLAAHDSTLSDLDTLWRYPGLHGHANASAAVASLIAPVGVYLYLTGAARAWVSATSVLLLLGAGHVTATRAPLLIAAATIVASLLCARRAALVLRAVVALGTLVLPVFLWLGPPGGEARWEDTGNISVNTGERLASNRIGLQLVAEHPLGVGVERSAATLEDELDVSSMHNAFLQMAAVFGLPLAAWVIVHMLALAARLPRGPWAPRALESALALQAFGVFFFEEHGNNPTFIAMMAWFVASSAWPGSGPREGAT